MGWMIPFTAGMIIGRFWIGLIVWFALAAIFFGYVEALILCRHCPHYAEEGFTLKCHANWGLPKIPKFNPKPLNKIESVTWIVYVLALFLYFVPFFIASQQWLLLVINTSALIIAYRTLLRTMCTRCYNFSCPLNRVPQDVRKVFFEKYPAFAEAWGIRTSANDS